jgi:NAD-dependent SIR2 family protein deacetylase
MLKDKKKILVLTGAGISAASGIPTFRGDGGFWRKDKV